MALDFVAGCIGGCAGVIVGHPLDTIKIRGLLKGVTSPLGGVALVNATVFGAYGAIHRNMGDESPKTHFWAGFGAGSLQCFITCPVELVKTRLQIQKGREYSGSLNCFTKVLKTDGLRGIFKGYGITTLREGPAYGAYFCTYQLLAGEDDAPTWKMMISGGLAGMISWIVVYPVDVVKTRFQADGGVGSARYTSALDCLVKSVRAEGYAFLFRGLTPTLIRSFPTNAVTFTAVTWTLRLADFVPDKDHQNFHNHHKMSWDPKARQLFEESIFHPI
ncbi:mitochondrial basic amino acids transporter-like isoform X2 [Cimex lectularius]|uniref:Uncharacterized protein n=1 Tax=Cimex lectularius TaxID=79782 RepID=A0A8I6TEQ6_CIMLE|nr:mitochondrial basic amino acids transporter-like isoform X2 [Cimex lectularius]